MKSQSEVSLNDWKGMKHEHNWRFQTKPRSDLIFDGNGRLELSGFLLNTPTASFNKPYCQIYLKY